MTHLRFLLIACLALLAACGTPPRYVWVKEGATQRDFDLQKARCEYEVSAATQGTNYGYRTSFGQELDRMLRQVDLEQKCFAAYGWTRVQQ